MTKVYRVVKGLLLAAVVIAAGVLGVIALSDMTISRKPAKYISDDINDLPECDAALVLGTAKYLSRGWENLYFKYRMETAAELYHSGKVKYIIVSGDNSREGYNEPLDMKNDLVAQGVPQEVI